MYESSRLKPACYNRPPFKDSVTVQDGWCYEKVRDELGRILRIRMDVMVAIPDPMSKTCQQHGPLGEATLHHGDWDCVGCEWMPKGDLK